jgi:hypothetical protein
MWHSKIKLLLVSILLSLSGSLFAQSQLPECQGSDSSSWSNCFGSTVFKFTRYSGEWKNGKFHGRGIVSYSNGDVTEGIWRDGTLVRAEKLNTQSNFKTLAGASLPLCQGSDSNRWT